MVIDVFIAGVVVVAVLLASYKAVGKLAELDQPQPSEPAKPRVVARNPYLRDVLPRDESVMQDAYRIQRRHALIELQKVKREQMN